MTKAGVYDRKDLAPEKWDWRMTDTLGPIRDIGSYTEMSWAFASVSAIEAQYYRKYFEKLPQ